MPTLTLSAISLQAKLLATLANAIDAVAAGATAAQGFTWSPATAFSTGTGANQADRVWCDTARLLSSGASENVDLYDLAAFDIGAGAGKDALGQAMTNAELVALLIANKSTSAGNLLIGGEGSAAAFQSIFHVSGTASDTAGFGPLKPGGCFFAVCPPDPAWAITDAANHLLKIAASGGDVSYDIGFLARSA